MRILHVIPGVAPESGGPTTVLRQLCNRLVERGHVVHVITSDASVSGRRVSLTEARAGYDERVTMELCRADLVRAPYPSVAHARAVWRAVRRFDVAHVHGVFALPVTQAMAIFRARGLPYVLRPCGMLDDYSIAYKGPQKRLWMRLVERANLEGAARIQASTEHEARALGALVHARLGERIVVLPQGVDAPPPSTGVRPHARPYLLFLSRIARKKGLTLLVDAFARVAAARPELDLIIAGPDEGGHRQEIERHVHALGLAPRVVLPGPVHGQAKSDLFAACEAFVLPSVDENFGVVVVEAASFGAPVVVSAEVGLAPAVARLEAGRVSARTPEALAGAIDEVLGRGRACFAPGLAALFAEHAWSNLVPRVEDLYRAILRGHRRVAMA